MYSMHSGIVIILIFVLLTATVYSLPKWADAIPPRWTGANGEECRAQSQYYPIQYTCCKSITTLGIITVLICIDCGEGFEGKISCGDAYPWLGSVFLETPGKEPKVKNYAGYLIRHGVAILNEGAQNGGVIDTEDKNEARNLIYRGLSLLSKQDTSKGTADLKVTKSTDALINKVLSLKEEILVPQDKETAGGILQDRDSTNGDNDTITTNNSGILMDRSKTK